MDQVSLSLLATPVLRDLYHQIMMELAKRENGWNNTLPHIFSPSPQATTLPVFVSVPPPSQPMQAPAPVVETPPPPQAPVNVTVPGVETRPLPKTGYRQRNATTKVPASKVRKNSMIFFKNVFRLFESNIRLKQPFALVACEQSTIQTPRVICPCTKSCVVSL